MSFKQVSKPVDTSAPPSQKEVVRWLWQVDKGPGLIVKKHGQKMLNTHFESIEAAKLFVLHGE